MLRATAFERPRCNNTHAVLILVVSFNLVDLQGKAHLITASPQRYWNVSTEQFKRSMLPCLPSRTCDGVIEREQRNKIERRRERENKERDRTREGEIKTERESTEQESENIGIVPSPPFIIKSGAIKCEQTATPRYRCWVCFQVEMSWWLGGD